MDGWNKKEQAFANARNAMRIKQRERDNVMDIGNERSKNRGMNNAPTTSRPVSKDNWESKQAETGPRAMMRCVLPNAASDGETKQILRESLCRIAGGFTEYHSHGGWINDKGVMEFETSITFEVSFDPRDGTIEGLLQTNFEIAGRAQGEVWTHIEYWPNAFQARHKKTN